MRTLLFVLSIASVAWVVASLLRQPANRMPWCALAYFLCQGLFTLASWWTWVRVARVAETAAYKSNFYTWASVMMAAAVVVSVRYVCQRDPVIGLMLFISCALFVLGISLFLGHWILEVLHLPRLSQTAINHLTFAGVLLTCGSVTFLSLVVQSGGIEDSVKLSLSLYWLCFSAYAYANAVGRLNPYLASVIRHDWFPSVAGVVACAWLAWTLSSKQLEISRQALPSVAAAEYSILEPSFERREL